MSAGTAGRCEMAVPTAEGITDAIDAIKAAMDVGKWTLIAPDGRVWMNGDPMILFAVLAAVMGGEKLAALGLHEVR